jgi:hypothetical protein
MIIHGLHHQIAMNRLSAGELARQARGPAGDPRTAYEKNCEAERLAKEAEDLAEHVKGNEQLMEGILHQILYLAKSPHQSRYRSLTLTALEQAHSWLMRENGEREPERDFKILSPTPAINGAGKHPTPNAEH